MLNPTRHAFTQPLEETRIHQPSLRHISTETGGWIAAPQAAGPGWRGDGLYWRDGLCSVTHRSSNGRLTVRCRAASTRRCGVRLRTGPQHAGNGPGPADG